MLLALALLLTSSADAGALLPAVLTGTVVYVVDGDTIHVRVGDRVEKVRYIGIDAPEVLHPDAPPRPRRRDRRRPRAFAATPAAGEAARRINMELVAGREVRLELDRQQRDDYQRLLAYVWVGDTLINAEMVRRGYAEAMSIPPDFRHRALLLHLEREAREAGRGLWRR